MNELDPKIQGLSLACRLSGLFSRRGLCLRRFSRGGGSLLKSSGNLRATP